MEEIKVMTPHKLAVTMRGKSDKEALIIDSRTFCEFNTSHVLNSINVWSSKIRKKRLQQDSISVHDYLQQACHVSGLHDGLDIIVYDQNAPTLSSVPQDSFLHVLLTKLGRAFPSVFLLAGGFLEFQARYPELCEDSSKKCTPLTSQSQPCMPVSSFGPTRVLPFLYLGSQHDAHNRQLLSDHNILYELNVSVSCPKPDFVQDSHFMRIPVNDNFSEKLLPHFSEAFNFIDKVRESGGCVLVHCLAGISRSATVAIAYVMKHLRLPFDEAYMYVKTRRPTISPNINFVGQLAELDRQLRRDMRHRDPSSAPIIFRTESHMSSSGSSTSSVSSSAAFASTYLERHACASINTMPKSLSLNLRSSMLEAVPASPSTSSPHSPADMSPSSALARLTFASALDELRDDGLPRTLKFPSSPVTPTASPFTPIASPLTPTKSPLTPTASPITCLPPSTPPTAVIRESSTSPVFSFRRVSSNSPSPTFTSFFKSKEVSSRTSCDYRSDAKVQSSRESFTSSDSIKSTSGSTSNFYSSATIKVGAMEAETETKDGKENKDKRTTATSPPIFSSSRGEGEGCQVSVCVIDVKREASPPRYVCSDSEPLVVRETQVLATPVHPKPEVRSVLEVQLEGGRQKDDLITVNKVHDAEKETKKPHPKAKEVQVTIERRRGQGDTPKPREVIVPIQVAASREGRPRVLELSGPAAPHHVATKSQPSHPLSAATANDLPGQPKPSLPQPAAQTCTGSLQPQPKPAVTPSISQVPTSGLWLPESPREASGAGPTAAATPGSPPSPGVQQSDSGIIVKEGERGDLPPTPQRLPRCYSSSETHLNTRRLLEHRNPDFTARKCSSYDEVGRAWPNTHHVHQHQPSVGIGGREGTSTTWLCPWELARSDSVSTSGFGSEISDSDLLHDDSHSTQDDAMGPYDAVFADVYPGEHQRPNQPSTPKAPRPASLPGVTGTYFSHLEANTDPGLDMGVDMGPVELRSGGRGHRGVEKKDSGYYSFLTEHPPVCPRTMGEGVRHTTSLPWPKERPRDLQLQITTIAEPIVREGPKTPPCLGRSHPSHPMAGENRTSPEKRMTPEKRKSRGSSTEENEEKRRSCEVETHQWTPPRQSSVNIGSGLMSLERGKRDQPRTLRCSDGPGTSSRCGAAAGL